jgi:hypothetical protein
VKDSLDFLIVNHESITHHGIKGMHWGIRRYQRKDGSLTIAGKIHYRRITDYGEKGGVIKKGTKLYRVSEHKTDPTFDKKKYVSTGKYDNAQWEEYLGKAYKNRGKETYNIKYKTKEDIKVASNKNIEDKVIYLYKNDPEFSKYASYSLSQIRNFFPTMKPEHMQTTQQIASLAVAAQTPLGHILTRELRKEGYGALADSHGANTSKDPLIILDPDEKLKRVSSKKF